jgi:predicted permease
MQHLIASVRYGVRVLFTKPSTTLLAIVALSLGIGLVTGMFTIVNGVVLRGLPYDQADQLYQIERTHPVREEWWNGINHADLTTIRENQDSFENISAIVIGTINLSDGETLPQRYDGAWVSSNFLDILRVTPLFGRGFNPQDDVEGAAPVALISHDLWQNHYQASPLVIGSSATMNGELTTIVGVMPDGFHHPNREQVWLPIHRNPAFASPDWAFGVFGRMRADVTPTQARQEFAGLQSQLLEISTDPNRERDLRLRSLNAAMLGNVWRTRLAMMMAAVIFVLLIACANVANLQLSRAATRTRELAIRNSLGARPSDLVIQLLVESTILAAIGAAGGLLLSRWGVSLITEMLNRLVPAPPYWYDFSIDGTILGVTVLLAIVTGLISGIAPAIQASRPDVQAALKDNTRSASSGATGRFTRILVVTQVALTCALLIGAGLMIKTMLQMDRAELPYQPDRVLGARIGLFPTDYPEIADRHRFWQDLVRRVNEVPGVEAAAVTNRMQHWPSYGASYEIFGQTYAKPDERPIGRFEAISADYFDTLDTPMIEGRAFMETDRSAAPVVIVNEVFARKHWPDESAIGKQIRPDFQSTEIENRWLTVVGVAPDLRMTGFADIDEDGAGFYVPMESQIDRFMTLMLRTQGDPTTYVQTVREKVFELDGNLPIYWPDTLQGYIDNAMSDRQMVANLFAIFGAIALVLAAIGIYGVMASSVNHRTKEIGVRIALGAKGGDIISMVVGQGATQLLIGTVIGLGLAFALSRFMATTLYNVPTLDLQIFVLVPAFLAAVACAATALPARRAVRIPPLVALRDE